MPEMKNEYIYAITVSLRKHVSSRDEGLGGAGQQGGLRERSVGSGGKRDRGTGECLCLYGWNYDPVCVMDTSL